MPAEPVRLDHLRRADEHERGDGQHAGRHHHQERDELVLEEAVERSTPHAWLTADVIAPNTPIDAHSVTMVPARLSCRGARREALRLRGEELEAARHG